MRRSPKDTDASHRKISRRALFIGGAQAAIVAGLGLRMRQMQVVEATQYRMLSDKNRINIRLIPPARGLIRDRSGILLAGNEQNYSVVIVREDAGDVARVLRRLSEIVPLSEEEIRRTIAQIRRHSPFVPITIVDRLSWDDLSRVAVNGPALPGISPEVGLSRYYPLAEDLAHVVGYVGPVSEADLKRNPDPDPLLQIPKFQIGKIGVEGKEETILRGTAGIKRIEVNSVGRVMRELSRQPGQPGADVQLTIDAPLQNFTLSRMGDLSAATVVMDVETGDLLASASSPSFNPNLFVRGISSKDYRGYMDNTYRPLSNKAVQGVYPPGSTYKIVTGLAALKSGRMKWTDKVYCPGYIIVSGRRFNCWKHSGHGWLDMVGALTQSCDVYFYEASQRVGIERMSAMATEMGMGIRHDLPMSAIAAGLNPDKAWKLKYRGKPWLIGDTINAAIGQGYVLASPLQLAVMTARAATGRKVQPRLLKAVNGVETPILPAADLAVPGGDLDAVRRGMYDVVNSVYGTARGSRIAEPTMALAGKTGTSQVVTISPSARETGVTGANTPWNERDHALFVCYAPFDKPRYAVAVVVEHGGGGSAVAAPIARDVMLQALYGGLPPLSAYPAGQRREIAQRQQQLNLRSFPAPQGGQTRA